MRKGMLELMNTLASSVIALNSLADDLMQAASSVDDAVAIKVMRGVASGIGSAHWRCRGNWLF
ncbi:hypothetical protein [Methylobacterium soli]|uniref:Uncharacterized protein n=1 Tax=Methylobacterium soli TaxID=553447 RepID=A0A6L3SWY0_9HYPH|nr:hypothetical protein [Methylobacterium soli]KAB1077852.1 hypothetical protein F6X53_16685 [Methylobacterium soli]GJE45869.1 hypothetical protein AEGHOMDF_5069 [Methylobacterium soli]